MAYCNSVNGLGAISSAAESCTSMHAAILVKLGWAGEEVVPGGGGAGGGEVG